MDIDGLGGKIVAQLIDVELVHDVADLYAITQETLLPLERFAEKKAQKLIEAIEASKQQPLTRLLIGLGIRHIGEVAARALADYYGSIDALLQATPEEIQEIDGVGPTIAESVADWIKRETTRDLVERLKQAGVNPTQPIRRAPKEPVGVFAGKTFVLTGGMSEPREKIAEWVESLGGKVNDSVSKRTSYVVAGEAPGASKISKATQLELPIINEDALRRMVAGS